MTRCTWFAGLAGLVAALAAGGCGSQESPTAPVAARIAGEAEPAAAATVATAGRSAAPQADPLHPRVELETSQGTITVELDAVSAPVTVHNFLNYVNRGHYSGTVFHYVAPDSMIVGGGFTAELEPKATSLPIRNEAHNGVENTRGTLAMSRSLDAIDSATCQFFINLADNPALDHQDNSPEGYGYCVFGRVISGMDVADQIGAVARHDQGEFVSTPQQPVVIRSIRQVY